MMNRNPDRLIELIQGLTGVITILIGRLEANKAIKFSDLASDLKSNVNEMSEEDRKSGAGFIFERYIDILDSLSKDPSKPPTGPNWLRGVIDGGKKD